MSLQPLPGARFIRRTQLSSGEYRKNFHQIDHDVIEALTSKEADLVTPLMSKVYLRMVKAPDKYWERDGVLRFEGEVREGKLVKAWAVLCELVGVASATASKALQWMHEQGIIGYFAGKNGVGIRIFFNRATSSIGVRAGKKILEFSPASFQRAPASQNEPAFKDNFVGSEASDQVNSPPAPKNGAAGQNRTLRTVPDPDSEGLLEQILAALQPLVAEVVSREGRRTFTRLREWLEKSGIPKATRVAVHEGYRVALRGERKAEESRRHEDWINTGRNDYVAHRAADAGPLSERDVELYARLCLEMFDKTGQLPEATLSELSAEVGGPVLGEDVPRIRAMIEELSEAAEARAGEPGDEEQARRLELLRKAYSEHCDRAFSELLATIPQTEFDRLVAEEEEPFYAEKATNRTFRGVGLRMNLEKRVMDRLRASMRVVSFEQFIAGE